MAQYMLLLYDDPSGWASLSPEEMQKATEKYMAWTQKPFTRDSQRLMPIPAKWFAPSWPVAGHRRAL